VSKHTQDQWAHQKGTSPHYQGQISSETTGVTIAITYNDESGANARLIAAAPELLEACKRALNLFDDPSNNIYKSHKEIISQAIAKAINQG